MAGESLTFWIDNAKYATVRGVSLKKGRAALLMEDASCVLYQPQITE